MSIPKETIYTNDKLPTLSFTINKEDGTGPFDLSGVSSANGIVCVLRLMGAASATVSGGCSVISATGGNCAFTLSSALTEPGLYSGQLILTLGGGEQRTSKFQLDVQEGLKSSG